MSEGKLNYWRSAVLAAALAAAGTAQAKGGFFDLDDLGATFDTESHVLDNPWWPRHRRTALWRTDARYGFLTTGHAGGEGSNRSRPRIPGRGG